MPKEKTSDHEGLMIVHGVIGVVFASIIGSFCGLFGRPIKRCFLKGAVIPGISSILILIATAKNCNPKEKPLLSIKSVGGFAMGYSFCFLVAYGALWVLRKFIAIFIQSLD